MGRNCNHCSVTLTENQNWPSSYVRKKYYICRSCTAVINITKNKKRMYVNGKYVPQTHPLWKPGYYKTFSDAAFDGTYKLDNIKEGYVYVITNAAWPGWVKIGMAIDAEDRLNSYQTSSPHRDYILEHSVYSNDRRKAEREAHKKAAKLSKQTSSEWFKLSVEQAINILDNLNEYGSRASTEANKVTPKDKLQERNKQADLGSYTEDRKAG